MSTTLFKDFTFEALTAYHVPEGHNVVACTGIPLWCDWNYRGSRSHTGWIIDFAELKAV